MVKPHSSALMTHQPDERLTPEVMVLVVPKRLSMISTRMLRIINTSSHTSNFLPAGVSLLKIISNISYLVMPRYFLGKNHPNSILCITRPMNLIMLRAIPRQLTEATQWPSRRKAAPILSDRFIKQ